MPLKVNKAWLESNIYVWLLIVFSGNPAFSIGTTLGRLAFLLVTFSLLLKNINYFIGEKALKFYGYILFFVGIFVAQNIVLGFVSYDGSIAFCLKIALAYAVFRHLGGQFPWLYLKTMYVISVISLVGYSFNQAGFDIPDFESTSQKIRSIFIFTQNGDGSRNSGMFWEPGAFACYINLMFLLHLGRIRHLIRHNVKLVMVPIIALVTTFSTTGYIVFFLIMIATIVFEYSRSIKVLIVPILALILSGAFAIYQNSPFLKEKIENQYATAKDLQGEFANTRFGALAFDIHYIKKHPWVGNGLHQKTRYADHPWLQNESLGHGNGFSHFLASMGILSFAFYALLILHYNRNHPWIFLLGVVTLLQGEQLMNYPLFLALPLVFIYGKESRRIADVS